jgi:hypothetical protein
VIAALNDYRLLPSEGWEKVANGRKRALWLAQKGPSSALSGTFSHAKRHGRRRQFQKLSLVSPNSLVSTS